MTFVAQVNPLIDITNSIFTSKTYVLGDSIAGISIRGWHRLERG